MRDEAILCPSLVGLASPSKLFPAQQPMEIYPELLTYVSVQLGIKPELIQDYALRQPTITEHRQAIIRYLRIRYFEKADSPDIDAKAGLFLSGIYFFEGFEKKPQKHFR